MLYFIQLFHHTTTDCSANFMASRLSSGRSSFIARHSTGHLGSSNIGVRPAFGPLHRATACTRQYQSLLCSPTRCLRNQSPDESFLFVTVRFRAWPLSSWVTFRVSIWYFLVIIIGFSDTVLSFSVIVFSDTFQLLGSNSWSEARTLLTASKPVEHGAPTSGQRVMTPLSIGVHGTNWRCLQ
jgi:hypothetical protein